MFIEKLNKSWQKSNSLLCVGLDPDPSRLPNCFAGMDKERAIFEFSKSIIDSTFDLASVFKPQIAYFAAAHAEGALQEIIYYIHSKYPTIPVVLDAKRGDIGSTAEKYAMEVFERFKADAVTVNPFMGTDSLIPFLSYREKGVVVLCRTSNPGAQDFQDLELQGLPLYQHVAIKLEMSGTLIATVHW